MYPVTEEHIMVVLCVYIPSFRVVISWEGAGVLRERSRRARSPALSAEKNTWLRQPGITKRRSAQDSWQCSTFAGQICSRAWGIYHQSSRRSYKEKEEGLCRW